MGCHLDHLQIGRRRAGHILLRLVGSPALGPHGTPSVVWVEVVIQTLKKERQKRRANAPTIEKVASVGVDHHRNRWLPPGV